MEEQGRTAGTGAAQTVPYSKPVYQAVRKGLREPWCPGRSTPTLTTLRCAGSPQRAPLRSSRLCGAAGSPWAEDSGFGHPGRRVEGGGGECLAGARLEKPGDRGPGMGVPPPPPHSPNGRATATARPPRLKRRDAPPPPPPPITGRLPWGADCLRQSALATRAAAVSRRGLWELWSRGARRAPSACAAAARARVRARGLRLGTLLL